MASRSSLRALTLLAAVHVAAGWFSWSSSYSPSPAPAPSYSWSYPAPAPSPTKWSWSPSPSPSSWSPSPSYSPAPAPSPYGGGGGSGECQSTAQGWSCPTNSGSGEALKWVAAHNVYRCMHNTPALNWNDAVYQSTYDYFANNPSMSHSDNYNVPPPAGPAGENMFMHSPPLNPADAAHWWYDEITKCPSLPGCKDPSWSTSHFTAMMWQGATELGCVLNKYNIATCRYKGSDTKGCTTPNFGGDDTFRQNVYPRVKTYTECKAAVEACGLTVEAPANSPYLDGTTGLYEQQTIRSTVPGYILPGMIGLVAAALAGAAVMRWRRYSAAEAAASTNEGLE